MARHLGAMFGVQAAFLVTRTTLRDAATSILRLSSLLPTLHQFIVINGNRRELGASFSRQWSFSEVD